MMTTTMMMMMMMMMTVCSCGLRGANAEKITETKYMALPLMKPGEVLFTEPQTTRLMMPEGHIAISKAQAWIVEATNTSFVNDRDNFEKEAQEREIPLSEVYNHHWIAVDLTLPRYRSFDEYAKRTRDQDRSFANGPCEALKWSFGGGSEMSSTPMMLPDPYAYVLRGDEYFGLNLHLIDLRGVIDEDVQRCVQCECRYLNRIRFGGDGDNAEYPNEGGGAQCCYGGMRCASTFPDEDLKQYYFKYEIVYERFDPNKHTPVYSSVFSASSDSAAICHVEFNPPVCSGGDHQEGPEREHTFGRCLDEDTATTEFMWQVNSDIDIIYGWGHAHIGSLNGVHTTVTEPAPSAESTNAQLVGFININGRDNDMKQTESGVTRDLCTSEPLYGDSEGDEDSFLAGVTTCTTPTRVPKNSVIHVQGKINGRYNEPFFPEYEDRENPRAMDMVKFGAPYYGSMVYFVAFYVFADANDYSQFSDVAPF